MGPKTKPAEPTRYGPHPDDAADVRDALEEADRGAVLSADASEAVLRWLETGEGPCPVDPG